jgi:outer membrane immunogenic protein
MKIALRAAASLLFAMLFLTAAHAADVPAIPKARTFNWTGFYLGVNAGYGWGNQTANYSGNDPNILIATCGFAGCAPPSAFRLGGGAVGGQLGYNYQFNSNWLVGLEADYDFSNIRGTGNSGFELNSVGPTNATANVTIESFGTIRGRLGYLATPSLLLYGTGGLAYGKVSANASMTSPALGQTGEASGGFAFICIDATTCFNGSSSRVMVGWTAGAGTEFAITDNFTAKLEYMYVNLGDARSFNTTATTGGGLGAPSSFAVGLGSMSFNVVRLGLNYKFN